MKKHLGMSFALASLLLVACGDSGSGNDANVPPPDQGSSSSIVPPSSAPTEDPAISNGTLIDARDNQTYKTVTIGPQTWMAENLNYDYNVGTAKSFVKTNAPKYGRFYLWSAAMDSAAVFSTAGKGCGYGVECSPSGLVRGVCPEGWHLPNSDEWQTLFTAVGGKDVAGAKLKSTRGWFNGDNGTDEYGFTVLPAGFRSDNLLGNFANENITAGFWTSTDFAEYTTYIWEFYYSSVIEDLRWQSNDKNLAISVRCVKD